MPIFCSQFCCYVSFDLVSTCTVVSVSVSLLNCSTHCSHWILLPRLSECDLPPPWLQSYKLNNNPFYRTQFGFGCSFDFPPHTPAFNDGTSPMFLNEFLSSVSFFSVFSFPTLLWPGYTTAGPRYRVYCHFSLTLFSKKKTFIAASF